MMLQRFSMPRRSTGTRDDAAPSMLLVHRTSRQVITDARWTGVQWQNRLSLIFTQGFM